MVRLNIFLQLVTKLLTEETPKRISSSLSWITKCFPTFTSQEHTKFVISDEVYMQSLRTSVYGWYLVGTSLLTKFRPSGANKRK